MGIWPIRISCWHTTFKTYLEPLWYSTYDKFLTYDYFVVFYQDLVTLMENPLKMVNVGNTMDGLRCVGGNYQNLVTGINQSHAMQWTWHISVQFELLLLKSLQMFLGKSFNYYWYIAQLLISGKILPATCMVYCVLKFCNWKLSLIRMNIIQYCWFRNWRSLKFVGTLTKWCMSVVFRLSSEQKNLLNTCFLHPCIISWY